MAIASRLASIARAIARLEARRPVPAAAAISDALAGAILDALCCEGGTMAELEACLDACEHESIARLRDFAARRMSDDWRARLAEIEASQTPPWPAPAPPK